MATSPAQVNTVTTEDVGPPPGPDKGHPHHPPHPPRHGSRAWLVVVLLLVLAAAGGGYWWTHRGHPTAAAGESGTAAASEGQEPGGSSESSGPVAVQVVHPRVGGMERTTVQTASVHSFEYADLFANTVSGYLKEQSVDIGDKVERGKILAIIEDPQVIKDAERAEASLKLAKTQVDQAKSQVSRYKADKEAAVAHEKKVAADLEHYKSNTRFRRIQWDRFARLAKNNATAQERADEEQEHYESALAAQHAAEADITYAHSQVIAADARVEQAEADVAEAEANVGVARANLEKAQVLVGFTKIASPYDGVVTIRNYHVGEFIRPGDETKDTPLLRVARVDKMRVVFPVPDIDVPFIDPGDPASLKITTLGGKEFKGKVARISYQEDPTSRTMRGEVDLENPDGVLREGMFGYITVELSPPTKGLTIRSDCLVGRAAQGKGEVYVARDGKAHKVEIRTGFDDGVRVEVVQGLKPDDQVILPTSAAIGEGEPVAATLIEDNAVKSEGAKAE